MEDNHQSFKEAIQFWLHLTSLGIFPGGGGSCLCMCARASVMWVFKSCFLQVVSTKYISAYKYYYRNLYSVYVAYLTGVLLNPMEPLREGLLL